jgi:hypothetical protein
MMATIGLGGDCLLNWLVIFAGSNRTHIHLGTVSAAAACTVIDYDLKTTTGAPPGR